MATVTITRNYSANLYNEVDNTTYTLVHNAASSTNAYENPSSNINATQGTDSHEKFWISRGALYFDTSGIPEGANITEAILRVNLRDASTVSMTIQNGQPTYPSNPAVVTDYLFSLYSGNGGQLPISGLGFRNIALTEDGISWINIGGETKLLLRADTDISSTSPVLSSEENQIRNDSSYYAAKLIITYTDEPVVTTQAAAVPVPVANPAYCEFADGNGTIVSGSNITERGFEISLAFSGTLYDVIVHEMTYYIYSRNIVIYNKKYYLTI